MCGTRLSYGTLFGNHPGNRRGVFFNVSLRAESALTNSLHSGVLKIFRPLYRTCSGAQSLELLNENSRGSPAVRMGKGSTIKPGEL